MLHTMAYESGKLPEPIICEPGQVTKLVNKLSFVYEGTLQFKQIVPPSKCIDI